MSTVAIERTVNHIAGELKVAPVELQRRSLEAFIERERRLALLDVADLRDRYGVRSAAELEAKIKQREIYSHPAWEELIEWQNLEAYLERLIHWQDELS
ncbi:MAG: hypothetical protein H8D78_14720 [Chloroflexi bacterium]|nr:hypothetical protein [Chloroflexota bacterium]